MSKSKLGILGGMGPQATELFYRRVVELTAAVKDQEHIETLILSDTKMPDRTAAILSGDTAPVYERLLADARFLESWGAACIAIPCNTSHTFVPQLQKELNMPIVNMVRETAAALKERGARRVGILATDGTIRMGLYHAACKEVGIEAVSPAEKIQRLVMSVIYDEVKGGRPVSSDKLAAIDAALVEMGCDYGVLSCTELSVCEGWGGLKCRYLEALNVLARRCVELCGYPLKNL